MNNVRPQFKLLNEEQIPQVYQYALRILSETGVRVVSPSVVKLLEKTGQAEVQGRSVKLSPELVEWAVCSAPPVIQMYDLDDAQAVLDEITKAGPGSSFLSSPSTLKNYKKSYYVSDVYSRWPMERWQAEGQPEAR